jgi:TRAP-type C4-dicarboxylate transport system substrate-binding protein
VELWEDILNLFGKPFLKLFSAALTAVWLSGGAVQAQEVTLTLHQFLPPQANVPKLILDVWADKVEQDSNGRIRIDRFPSMQLGGRPPELIDQAIDGVADIVWTVVGYTPGRFPRTEVFELPFMMTNARAASRAYWDMFDAHMRDTDFKDVEILGTWVHGPGIIHANTQVRLPEDLQGLKVRGGSRLVNMLLEKAGAEPVGMPVPAVPEGLSKGVIDGTTIPWEVTTALKIPELVSHHTEFPGNALYVLTFVLAMNKDRYDSLPDDLRAVLDANSGVEFSVFAGGVMEDNDAPARKLAAERGNEIVTISEAEAAEWQDVAEPIYAEWVAEMAEKGIDGQALIDEARMLIEEYTAK